MFAIVRTDDGMRIRRPLFAVAAPGLLVAPPAGAEVELTAVGTEAGSWARPLSRDELRAHDDAPELVERCLADLADSFGAAVPVEGTSITDEEPVELEAGATAWPATHTVWVEASAPLRAYGSATAEASILPLPPQAWLTASAATVAQPRPAGYALATADGWSGVDAFLRAACEELCAALRAEQDASAGRIDRRRSYEDDLLLDTYTALGAVLGERGQRELAGTDGDALLAAVRAVGRSLGVTIKAPPPSASGGVVDPLDAITRASGVRMRRVALDPGWWTHDVGPLVATLAESGRPVALVPRRPGSYDLVDPQEGSRTRVTAAVAATIATDATMLYRPLPPDAVSGRQVLGFMLRPVRADLVRHAPVRHPRRRALARHPARHGADLLGGRPRPPAHEPDLADGAARVLLGRRVRARTRPAARAPARRGTGQPRSCRPRSGTGSSTCRCRSSAATPAAT